MSAMQTINAEAGLGMRRGGSLVLSKKRSARAKRGSSLAPPERTPLFESAPIGNIVLDEQGLIKEINLAGATILGGDRNDVLHHPFIDFILPAEAESWRRCFLRSTQSTEHQGCEMWLKRLDGKNFHARMGSLRVQIGGVPVVSIVLTDISLQKRREKEMADRRNEMAELKKMQIAFQTAAAIAHDLNQPLLAIASYSEAALALLKSDKLELNKIVKAIASCERQAQRAGKSIHELLDHLSIKEVSAEVFDLNKTVGEVVNAARSEHELQFESILILEDRLPPVFANRAHVEKVLFNLLINSIEAMYGIDVSLPVIKITVRTGIDAHSAQLTIQDNGPGIGEGHLHLLFKPFFTTKSKGIGMGLAVSRSLIEANGGQLWVDSREGPGATFHLTLPFAS